MLCKCGHPFDELKTGAPLQEYEILRCKACASVMINRRDEGDKLIYTQFYPTSKTEALRNEYKNRK